MSKLPNIIQRRELEPLLLKADRIARHYEKAANCAVSVMSTDCDCENNHFNLICGQCDKKNKAGEQKTCAFVHTEAVNKAKQLGGLYIYGCSGGLVFWTSPFYSGERFAGAFLSGGIRETVKNKTRVKALANMMLLCADQISGMSFVQKKIPVRLTNYVSQNVLPESEAKNDVCTIDIERRLVANLRRGDNTEAGKILNNLLDIYYRKVKCNLPAFRFTALELAVLLSRAASESDIDGINDNTVLETNNRYLNKIKESSDFQEITVILSSFMEMISGNFFSFHGVRHFPALRKAERFIWENYTRKLSLKEIATVSGLSAPYFSAIFKQEMGENLSNYLNRLRVEKAATMLLATNLPISEIAKTCGFEDQSWFSKIFKNNTGFTPGKYRDHGNINGISA
ncbi:MAG: helix-turn-helix domain-containing protein [Treponema sp.]|jgi:AraC-like DNA-binding protein/ligand-binding sensor protein|nr:helix-turn-helix domain-containing protein [Treponema sp.]